jgi:hypothetical protein
MNSRLLRQGLLFILDLVDLNKMMTLNSNRLTFNNRRKILEKRRQSLFQREFLFIYLNDDRKFSGS